MSAVVGYGQLLEGLAYSTVAIEAVIYMHLLYFLVFVRYGYHHRHNTCQKEMLHVASMTGFEFSSSHWCGWRVGDVVSGQRLPFFMQSNRPELASAAHERK